VTTAEPFVPHPDDQDDHGSIPAADPGAGAPAPAPGFGVEGEEPDLVDREPASDPSGPTGTPYRTPELPGDN